MVRRPRKILSAPGLTEEQKNKIRKEQQTKRLARKKKVADMLPFDPIVTFGKHKDDGLKLSELPISYVEFLCRPTAEGEDFTFKGINWTASAKFELNRRRTGGPIPTRAQIPVTDDDIPPPLKGSHGRAKTELCELSETAIDSASLHLLRDFITRKDKSKPFTAWLKAYAQEAARYGVLDTVEVLPTTETLVLDYRDLRFEIRVARARLTLNRIYPHAQG